MAYLASCLEEGGQDLEVQVGLVKIFQFLLGRGWLLHVVHLRYRCWALMTRLGAFMEQGVSVPTTAVGR